MAREAPYLEVAEDLRARIRRGEWAEGVRVPSRAQLALEYGVGRNVTQRAVDRLIVEGLLEGRAGSGTYVRKPRERSRMVRSLSAVARRDGDAGPRMRALDRTAGAENRTRARVPAPADIAARLGIAEGTWCMCTDYEFLTELQPVKLATSWEPMALTEGTPVHLPEVGPFKGKGVIPRMQSIGFQVDRAVETLRPGRATPTEAALLGLIPGDLVTRIERTYFTTDGRAVETADITVPDVRFEISYEIGLPH